MKEYETSQGASGRGLFRAAIGAAPAGRTLWRWLAAGALLGASLQAHAAINALTFRNSTDGTPGWDAAAGPGFDTGSNNLIVRTNDQFEYLITFSTDGGGDNNVTLVSTLPTGNIAPRIGQPVARWTNLPSNCTGPGSSISANGQTLTCNLGNMANSGTQSVYLNGTVLGTTPNGTALPAPSLVASSSATPSFQPTETPQALAVTAAPFYDVVVQMSWAGNPRAYGFLAANGPAGQDGFFHRPLVGLVAKNPNGNGNKGVEQLDPAVPVHYVMNVAGYPTGVLLDNWHNGTPPHGTPASTGGFVNGCGSPSNGTPSLEMGGGFNMYDRVQDSGSTASTATNTVPNGGACANAAQSGTTIAFDVNGIDTTLQRRPTITGGSAANPIPASEWWVSNKGLVLWTPATSYPTNTDINHTISLGSVTGSSISGQPITGDNPANNSTSYLLRTLNSGSASKLYGNDTSLPVPYQTQCDPAITGDCHVNYMTPGQAVRPRIVYSNTGTFEHTNAYLCEIIDRTAFDIGPTFGASVGWSNVVTAPAPPTIRYGARAAGSLPYFASTDAATDPRVTDATNSPPGNSEYSQASCSDPNIHWFSTAAAADAAGGLVYVRADAPVMPAGSQITMYTQGLVLRSTWGATIQVQAPSAAAGQRTAGQQIPQDTILRNRGETGSSYWPGGNKLRDHLQVVRMRTTSRVTKSAVSPANAQTAPQPVGSTLTYRLQPRYSTLFPPVPGTYTVTDVLPPNLLYVPGSATVGGTAQEPVVSLNTPATGFTRLEWTLPGQTPFQGGDGDAANQTYMPAIEFKATIALTAPDSTVLSNAVAVSGASDFAADCSYSAATQSFGACVKAASASVAVQTPPGFQVQKTTPTPLIEPGQDFRYGVTYVSFGAELPQRDIPDFIDILPYVGDGSLGRTPPSSFDTGAYRLVSVTPPANDPGMRVYYTHAAPAGISNDPRHASNQLPGGTTRWCTAAELGSAGCPASIGDSTAVRVSPSLTRLDAGTIYSLQITLRSNVSVAKQGDLFANSVGGRSPNPLSDLLFVSARTSVQVAGGGASLSGLVFQDDNDSGAPDAGEIGIGGVDVTLHGCVAGPDGVLQTTAIVGDPPVCAGDDVLVTRTLATQPDGSYRFDNLPGGLYRLTEAQPAGYHDGKRHVGSAGGTPNAQGTVPSVITDISLGTNVAATNYDFGEIRQSVVTVVKTSNPASGTSVAAGQTITYTVRVTVADAPIRSDVTLTDTLGAGLDLVPGSLPAGGACTAAGQVITCTLAAGAAVGAHDFSYQATVATGATGSADNTVVPGGGDNPTCGSAEACRTSHPVGGSGGPAAIPVNAPWALLMLSVLVGWLARRRRRG